MNKVRLDLFLVQNGYFKSREKAKQAILDGLVVVNGMEAQQAKLLVSEEDTFSIQTPADSYVGRGAFKLKHALSMFSIDLSNRMVLDIGASTGGFTQVALEHGAASVYALDVGTNQLDEVLRNDSRVIVMEHRNFRYAERSWFDKPADFVCCDVSFISLRHIIPALEVATHDNTEFVFLVKPQFEAGPDYVNKHGVVTSKSIHKRILEDIWQLLLRYDIKVQNVCVSPITGKEGNIEYLVHAKRNEAVVLIDFQKIVDSK